MDIAVINMQYCTLFFCFHSSYSSNSYPADLFIPMKGKEW